MIELELIIPNKLGLHARAAAKLVTIASQLDITMTLSRDGNNWVDARNIMGLMMLGAGRGTPVNFRIEGGDADQGKTDLEALFERNFDEQD